jgi:hypothetical protein
MPILRLSTWCPHADAFLTLDVPKLARRRPIMKQLSQYRMAGLQRWLERLAEKDRNGIHPQPDQNHSAGAYAVALDRPPS